MPGRRKSEIQGWEQAEEGEGLGVQRRDDLDLWRISKVEGGSQIAFWASGKDTIANRVPSRIKPRFAIRASTNRDVGSHNSGPVGLKAGVEGAELNSPFLLGVQAEAHDNIDKEGI